MDESPSFLVLLGVGLAIYGASFELLTGKRYLPDVSWLGGHKTPICLACPELDDSHIILPQEKSEKFDQSAELVRIEYQSCLDSPRYPSQGALKHFGITADVNYEDDPRNLRSDGEIRGAKKKEYCTKRAAEQWDHEYETAAGVHDFHFNPLSGYDETSKRWNETWKGEHHKAAWDIGFGAVLNFLGGLWIVVTAMGIGSLVRERIGEAWRRRARTEAN